MRYPKVTEGIFIHRENRFIAQVQIGEKTQIVSNSAIASMTAPARTDAVKPNVTLE